MKGEVSLRVRYAETDQMGVVYHSEYLVWCEIGRTELIRSAGLPYADMERAGVRLAVTEAVVRYHSGARYDDLIIVETRLSEVRSRGVTFDYVISEAETRRRLVSAQTRLVAIDSAGRPAALLPEHRRVLETALSSS
ncbi:MAG: acyl-CoA thioesterase [Gemmatimonadota bacterium]